MTHISIRQAATLAQQAYDPKSHADIKNKISWELVDPIDDVRATMLNDGTLLIAGSRSIADYVRFNLQMINFTGPRLTVRDSQTEKGASGTRWHQGFLKHARKIFNGLNGRARPKLIIGHSLGAASAQILSKSYDVPAVGFASPRPHFGKSPVKNEKKMLNVCRTDDRVCFLPPGFRRLGRTVMLKPGQPNAGLDHSMSNYIGMLKFDIANMPTRWPG